MKYHISLDHVPTYQLVTGQGQKSPYNNVKDTCMQWLKWKCKGLELLKSMGPLIELSAGFYPGMFWVVFPRPPN